MSVVSVIQHVMRMRHITLSFVTLLDLPNFFTFYHKWHGSREKVIEHKNVF